MEKGSEGRRRRGGGGKKEKRKIERKGKNKTEKMNVFLRRERGGCKESKEKKEMGSINLISDL